jgi:hypothetical protein
MAEVDLRKEGSITFWARHEHPDWATNSHSYKWGPIAADHILVAASKDSDAAIEVEVSGPFGETFSFRQKMPLCGPHGLFVAVTWKDGEVILYLNGEKAASKRAVSFGTGATI